MQLNNNEENEEDSDIAYAQDGNDIGMGHPTDIISMKEYTSNDVSNDNRDIERIDKSDDLSSDLSEETIIEEENLRRSTRTNAG